MYGGKAKIEGVGSGTLVCVNQDGERAAVKVCEVLYVPKLASGLISVSSLVKKAMHVVFHVNTCEIKLRDRVIAVAERCGNLYKLSSGVDALVRTTARK